jgi:transposase
MLFPSRSSLDPRTIAVGSSHNAGGVMYRGAMWNLVQQLHAGGESKAAIARSLGISRTTVRRLLDTDRPPRFKRGVEISDEALGKLARALLAFAYEELERRNRTE